MEDEKDEKDFDDENYYSELQGNDDNGDKNPIIHVARDHVTVTLIFAVSSAVWGSFQFGYNTGVVNAPQMLIETFINDTYKSRYNVKFMPEDRIQFLWAFIVAIFSIGGLFGSFCAGKIANAVGRSHGMLFSTVLSILAGLLMWFSKQASSYEMLVIGRFIIGFYCGISTGLVPMYLSEIAPTNLRGAVGVFHQLFVTIGVLVSQILGLNEILGTEQYWPLLLGLTIIPAVYQILTLPFCPESPRYLLFNKQKVKESEKALQRLRGTLYVMSDMKEMKEEYEKEKKEEKTSVIGLFKIESLRRPLVISVVLQISQQFSGINVVLYYSTLLFISAGISEKNSQYATVSTGITLVVFTLISVPLMDRVGRRTLHLSGLAGMICAATTLTLGLILLKYDVWNGAAIISIISTIVFVASFSIGPGSIPWLIVVELFAHGERAAAMSVAYPINWLSNFLVGISFPALLSALNAYVFLLYIVLLLFFWLFTFKFVPETKNKSFEEIVSIFRQQSMKDYGTSDVTDKDKPS
uniref:Solute carrier family 2, facilitated glucose transporter member 3-like n=1 Tax=Saccoglossus kowalevskii TaxID=10224 RepID=A0ABM0MIR6_SACKO|nr:PREDICTED: solute carrier family 2, facilitated glucose transporter member 3-like [Saccoglossus kowalevskii]